MTLHSIFNVVNLFNVSFISITRRPLLTEDEGDCEADDECRQDSEPREPDVGQRVEPP